MTIMMQVTCIHNYSSSIHALNQILAVFLLYGPDRHNMEHSGFRASFWRDCRPCHRKSCVFSVSLEHGSMHTSGISHVKQFEDTRIAILRIPGSIR